MATSISAVVSCEKKFFHTEADAVSFEKSHRETNGSMRQYPYKCESCTGYHLSCLQPGENELNKSTSRYSLANVVPPARRHRRTKAALMELRGRIQQMREEGMKPGQIAEELGETYSNVHYLLSNMQMLIKTKPGKEAPHVRLSMDSLETEEQKLEAQLVELRKKKEMLLEAKKLKVGWYTNAGSITAGTSVRISKEGAEFICTLDTAKELIGKLQELISQ